MDMFMDIHQWTATRGDPQADLRILISMYGYAYMQIHAWISTWIYRDGFRYMDINFIDSDLQISMLVAFHIWTPLDIHEFSEMDIHM